MQLCDYSVEELEKALAKKKQQMKTLKELKPLMSIDVKPFVEFAERAFQNYLDNGCEWREDSDDEHWCFEIVMETVYGEDFFDKLRNRCE